jgi:hypothetical protein
MGPLTHLTRKDLYIVTAFLAVSVLSGFAFRLLETQQVVPVHDTTFYIPGIVLLIGTVFIYLAREGIGGVVARNLEVTGTGMTLLGIFWVLFAEYFTAGNPAWLGIAPPFWTVFIMGTVTSSFFLIAYGFYLFWKSSGGGAY